MPNTLEILIRARDDASPAMARVASAASAMGNAVDAASKNVAAAGARASTFTTAAGKIDSAGRNARIGLASMGQAAQLLGVDLNRVILPAANAADAIGDMVGAIGSLGMMAGVAGIVIAAFAALQMAVENYNKSIAASIMYNNAYLQDAHMLAAGNRELAASFERLKQASISSEQLGLDDVIRANPQLQALNSALNLVGLGVKDMNAALREARTEWEVVSDASTQLYDSLERTRETSQLVTLAAYAHASAEQTRGNALQYAAAAAARLANSLGDTRKDAIDDYRAGARSISEMNTKAWLATHEFKAGAGWVEKIGANAEKATTSVSQMVSKLKGLVEGALNATTVEQRLGMAGDAWDEFRLRLEAVATGTDPAQYGEQFTQMFNALGMSAERAAAAFKDFSLFADPSNIKLVNMQPILDSVKQSLDSMIGKANLTSAAMKEVWKNLSPQQKAALAEQGIDSASEAIAALVDPTTQAKSQVQQLGAAMNAIPNNVTTTFSVVKDAAEKAIQEFQEVLDAFIARYGSVNISITAETTAVEPTAAAVTPTYDQYANVPTLASGGYVEREGLAYIHSGERVLTRAETRAYNTTTQNFGGITVILPNVTRGQEFVQELNRALGKRASLRAALGN